MFIILKQQMFGPENIKTINISRQFKSNKQMRVEIVNINPNDIMP
jgi:hypothetical protein